MAVRERAHRVPKNRQGLPALNRDAKHVGQLPDRHLDPDAGQEPDEHGPGQEVRQEAKPGQPGEHQQHRG